MVEDLIIRPERERDRETVAEINRLAFDGEAEVLLIEALREGGHVRLSLVAEDEGEVVGHILFSQIQILVEEGSLSALALAPMAVHPERQREGIGSALVEHGLEMAREHGNRVVLVVGHPGFYPKFGFSAEMALPLQCEYAGEAFMAVELASGALDGVGGEVIYPAPFREV